MDARQNIDSALGPGAPSSANHRLCRLCKHSWRHPTAQPHQPGAWCHFFRSGAHVEKQGFCGQFRLIPDAPTAPAAHPAGSAVTFICEVGTVDDAAHTTGWREVARYANEESAMDFVACNSHCVCRYRQEPPNQ